MKLSTDTLKFVYRCYEVASAILKFVCRCYEVAYQYSQVVDCYIKVDEVAYHYTRICLSVP
jgi:hypothetical protein